MADDFHSYLKFKYILPYINYVIQRNKGILNGHETKAI